MKLPLADKNWYVLTARVGLECRAADELRLGGYHCYLPMRRVRDFIRRHRLITNQQRPLLPGYVFLATEKATWVDWGHLRSERLFPHVGRPLQGSCGPLAIPGELIVRINEDEIAGEFDETGETKKQNLDKLAKRFKAGKKFRINEGPFSGFMALSEGVTAKQRVKALVSIFGRLSTVDFDPEQLEAA
jgi:transcription antitermination factor NusG